MNALDRLNVATMHYICGDHSRCKEDFDWFVWNERKKAGVEVGPEPHLPECRSRQLVDSIFQTDPLIRYLVSRRETMQYRGGTQTEAIV